MNRRQFLHTAAGLSLAGTSGYAAEFADQKPIRVGLIGSGWYGKSDIFRLNQIAPIEIVSLCDVDKRALEMAAQWSEQKQPSKKRPRLYTDYREMLKEKDLDIVLIATPDHWHALPMIAACEAGADIYVQKPISVDVVEGQAMLAAARKYKRVVQVGTQRRSTPHLIEARNEIIQAGKLGKIGAGGDLLLYAQARRCRCRQLQKSRRNWITSCGPARRPCCPYNALRAPRTGGRSWSTATASSATWESTCSIWCAG